MATKSWLLSRLPRVPSATSNPSVHLADGDRQILYLVTADLLGWPRLCSRLKDAQTIRGETGGRRANDVGRADRGRDGTVSEFDARPDPAQVGCGAGRAGLGRRSGR